MGPIQKRPTAAEGIAISDPVRGKPILRALRDSEGMAFAVSDEAIWSSVELMASKGVYIEPTSATAVAGYNTLKASGAVGSRDVVVIPLTGFGLKATDKLVEHYGSP